MTVDQLEAYGLERMDDDAVTDFLAAESTGVLGLPADDAPYLLPMSYSYDPDGPGLYFAYLLGPESRKADRSARADRARFLVYDVETAFTWESVLAAGPLRAVPESEWPGLAERPENAWRPNLLQAADTADAAVYELAVDEVTGLRATGLAPEFRENINP